MGWLFKKKDLDKFLTSDEFKTLEKKNVEFSSAIDILKQKMEMQETNFRSLRSKINCHISNEPLEEERKPTKKGEDASLEFAEGSENSIKPSIFARPDGTAI